MTATAATANKVDQALRAYLALPGHTKILLADKFLPFLEKEFPDLFKIAGVNGGNGDNSYTLWWRHGERQVITGPTFEAAFTRAGYGAGAAPAVDWYDHGDVNTHEWVPETKSWIKKQQP